MFGEVRNLLFKTVLVFFLLRLATINAKPIATDVSYNLRPRVWPSSKFAFSGEDDASSNTLPHKRSPSLMLGNDFDSGSTCTSCRRLISLEQTEGEDGQPFNAVMKKGELFITIINQYLSLPRLGKFDAIKKIQYYKRSPWWPWWWRYMASGMGNSRSFQSSESEDEGYLVKRLSNGDRSSFERSLNEVDSKHLEKRMWWNQAGWRTGFMFAYAPGGARRRSLSKESKNEGYLVKRLSNEEQSSFERSLDEDESEKHLEKRGAWWQNIPRWRTSFFAGLGIGGYRRSLTKRSISPNNKVEIPDRRSPNYRRSLIARAISSMIGKTTALEQLMKREPIATSKKEFSYFAGAQKCGKTCRLIKRWNILTKRWSNDLSSKDDTMKRDFITPRLQNDDDNKIKLFKRSPRRGILPYSLARYMPGAGGRRSLIEENTIMVEKRSPIFGNNQAYQGFDNVPEQPVTANKSGDKTKDDVKTKDEKTKDDKTKDDVKTKDEKTKDDKTKDDKKDDDKKNN